MRGGRVVVACLGSSSTAGQGQAFGWIDELSRRAQNARFDFRNLGQGGDLAYNALQRVPSVIACDPGVVIVLIGANDALTIVFENARRVLTGFMHHSPRAPSAEWFDENLQEIVHRLKQGTRARIALSSLGPIGEDPDSTDPVQRRLNDVIRQLSETVKRTAHANGLDYLPFNERFSAEIAASPGKALTHFRFLPIYLDTFRYYVLRRSSDEIGLANGWQFHVDASISTGGAE